MYETTTERGAGECIVVYYCNSSLHAECCSVLDERIEEMGDILKQHYDIVDFGDPNSITEVFPPTPTACDPLIFSLFRTTS